MDVHFNGSLHGFQSLMSSLHSQHGGREWTLPSGARLVVEERPPSDPTIHMSWVVSIPLDVDGSNKRHALIQAFSRDERSTVILLHDSRTLSPNPTTLGEIQDLGPDRAIGPPFDELCQELQRQMREWAPPPTTPHPQGNSTQFSPLLTPPQRTEPMTTSRGEGGRPTPAGVQTESPSSIEADATTPMPAEGTGDLTIEQAEQLLSDRATMLQYMPKRWGYDVGTAKAILSAIPKAWMDFPSGQWGPGHIAQACELRLASETVGRYLKAFVKRGITAIEGIQVPYQPRQKHHQKHHQ